MNPAISVILTILSSLSIAAAPDEPRRPTAHWVVNYDDAQCVASRNYGTDEKPLFLALKPSPTGRVMRMMLIRKGSLADAEQRSASVRFGDGSPIVVNALAYADRQTRHFVASINLPAETVIANRNATSVAIKGSSFDERLAVPGLAGVMATFDDCLSNLREVWNIGSAYAGRIKEPARPKTPLRDLFHSTAYPRQAIAQHDTGRVGLALLIDEAGKVRDCMVEETSGFATLDTTSCYVITAQARFAPAVGADGKPAKSASFHRIVWRIGP